MFDHSFFFIPIKFFFLSFIIFYLILNYCVCRIYYRFTGFEDEKEGSSFGANEHLQKRPASPRLPNDWSLTMEIAQLLLSLLHGWTLDKDLDHVCQDRLGLARPKSPACFGLISRSGGSKFVFPILAVICIIEFLKLLCRTYDVNVANMACM